MPLFLAFYFLKFLPGARFITSRHRLMLEALIYDHPRRPENGTRIDDALLMSAETFVYLRNQLHRKQQYVAFHKLCSLLMRYTRNLCLLLVEKQNYIMNLHQNISRLFVCNRNTLCIPHKIMTQTVVSMAVPTLNPAELMVSGTVRKHFSS